LNAEVTLPGQLQVLLRGWLSSNNILARGASETVLIDSGYVTHASQTVALVEHALAGGKLARLVNTHCHSDHMGGNCAVQARFGCRTTIPAGEAPLIDAWDERSLMLDFADQQADRFRYDDVLAPGDSLQMGDLDWQVLAAPGHDPHALMFYSPQARVLISGDALWENGFGVIFPQLYGRDSAFRETRETLERIASLDVAVVIPGHGRAFGDVGAALERAFARLDSFEQDILRLVRHTVKVMFTFALLEKQAMPLASLPRYVGEVGILRDLNERYLRMTPSALAQWLVRDLERAGAVACEDGMLVPRVAA
jgi:glyoxylase-like metal-dependent hydrolase (beta-lactamase superfamily II)